MVGVPGKSKGCSTCRRRKKGCDQQRPICGQCAGSGYTCGGYKRELTFIHHPASKMVEKATFISPPRKANLAASPFWNYSIIDSQCRSMFWEIYMPKDDCVVREQMILRSGHPMDWTRIVQELPGHETSLELAFSALSISQVGRDTKDSRLLRESTKLYGKALKDLQTALYDPERMYSDEVLTASMLLGLYEVLEGSSRKSSGWFNHTQGAARLVELRGAERHTARQAHHVFLGARLPVLYAGILQRKTTFLSSEAWLTLPWVNLPRTYHDRLVDIMTQVPALLEQVELANAVEDKHLAQKQRLQILEQCRVGLQTLVTWRNGAKKECLPKIIQWRATPDDTYPFDAQMWFKNHLFAQTFVIYWSSCLMLSDIIHELEVVLDVPDSPEERKSPETSKGLERATTREYAINIAQSIPYCLQLEMGVLGANLISFPTSLAYQYFKKSHDTNICRWFEESFTKMNVRGLRIACYFGALLDAEDGSCQDIRTDTAVVVPPDKATSPTNASKASIAKIALPEATSEV